MAPSTHGKIAAGIAGTTGTGGLGIIGFAAFRMASAHAVPGGVWTLAVALLAATAVVSSLGLILDYKIKKLTIDSRNKDVQAAAELQQMRLETYRVIMEKAAGEPESAPNYHKLIIADALHLSVEQNGERPADATHAELYRTGRHND